MAVTEQQRHRLLAWFEEHMGPDLGGTMMDLLPPADASALATKADVSELRVELRAEIGGLRAEIKEDLLQLQRTLGTWLFASQAAVIAVVGVLVAVLAAVS